MSNENLIYNIDGVRQPYSMEAEQAVLGSILIDPACLNDIAVKIKA